MIAETSFLFVRAVMFLVNYYKTQPVHGGEKCGTGPHNHIDFASANSYPLIPALAPAKSAV
jgi:hypothetical protein